MARLQTLDEELDRFDRSVGLPTSVPSWLEPAALKILDYEPEVFRHMPPEELDESSYVLERFAFSLQQATNRQQSKLTYAASRLALLIAPTLARQPGSSAEERRLVAIRGNRQALELEAARVEAQLRLDRLAYMAAKVASLARAVAAMRQNRRQT